MAKPKYNAHGRPAPTNRQMKAVKRQTSNAGGGTDSCLIAMFTIPLICCWRLVRHGSIQPK